MKPFNKITIIGVGLLGASLGLAIKKKKLAREITGYFRYAGKIDNARKIGAVDSGTTDLKTAVSESDLIILCSPVNDIIKKLKLIKPWVKSDALITDVGSTKSRIVETGRGLNFVGSHPLAGSEKSGAASARADLFKQSLCLLAPTATTKKTTLNKIKKFWEILGSRTIKLTPQKHDSILALTSHLPHVIAFSLVNTVPGSLFKFSAGAFKDTTRIASSSPDIWVDILASNQREIFRAISAFEKQLTAIKSALKSGNTARLLQLLSTAQKKRQKF